MKLVMAIRVFIPILIVLSCVPMQAQKALSFNTSTTIVDSGDELLTKLRALQFKIVESDLLTQKELKQVQQELEGLNLKASNCKKECREVISAILYHSEMRHQFGIVQEVLRLLKELGCEDPNESCYYSYTVSKISFLIDTYELDSAKALFNDFSSQYDTEGDPHEHAVSTLQRGLLASAEGRGLEAIQHYEDAALLFEELGLREELATARSNIGAQYSNLKLYEKAKSYYVSSLGIFQELGLYHRIAMITANASIAFMRLEQLDSAVYYAEEALRYHRLEKNDLGVARVYSGLGNIVRRLEEYDRALAYADSSIAICEQLGVNFGVALNLVNKSETYLKAGRYTEALNMLNRLPDYLPEALPPAIELGATRNYAEIYLAQGNYAKSAEYFGKWSKIKDETDEAELQALMLSMDNSFEEMRAERQISTLHQRLKTSRLQNQLAWVSVILLLVFAIGVYYWAMTRRRTHRLEVELAQRKLNELELEMEVKQKHALYEGMKEQFVSNIEGGLVEEVKAIKSSLPAEYQHTLDRLSRHLHSMNVKESVDALDQKLSDVYEDFQQQLLLTYPDLTPNELTICNLIKLNLTSREIAKIINRSEKTVNNLRSSIRRKMNLEAEVNLTSYLISLDASASDA